MDNVDNRSQPNQPIANVANNNNQNSSMEKIIFEGVFNYVKHFYNDDTLNTSKAMMKEQLEEISE
ncbi:MAG: hypothetical protein ACRBBN_05005 [Methyloligellaceae bacterium]